MTAPASTTTLAPSQASGPISMVPSGAPVPARGRSLMVEYGPIATFRPMRTRRSAQMRVPKLRNTSSPSSIRPAEPVSSSTGASEELMTTSSPTVMAPRFAMRGRPFARGRAPTLVHGCSQTGAARRATANVTPLRTSPDSGNPRSRWSLLQVRSNAVRILASLPRPRPLRRGKGRACGARSGLSLARGTGAVHAALMSDGTRAYLRRLFRDGCGIGRRKGER